MSMQTIQKVRKKRKKARRAAENAKLRGTKINKEDLDYKNVATLQRLMSAQGKMFSRKRSGLPAPLQREATRAIKRARFLGLLPYIS